VYVNDESGVVAKYTPAGDLVWTQRVASGFFGLAVDPSSGDLYVSDHLFVSGVKHGLVRELAPDDGTQLGTIPTAPDPGGVAVDPATGAVYVGLVNGAAVQLFGIPPAISGSPLDGATVYASRPSQVGRGPFTYTYQWLDCPSGGGACTANGPTSSSGGLRLKPSDEGRTIEVAVTETSPAGTTGPVISAPIRPA